MRRRSRRRRRWCRWWWRSGAETGAGRERDGVESAGRRVAYSSPPPAASLCLGRAASLEAGGASESRGHSGSDGGGSEPITYYNCLARRARASACQASIIATNGSAANNIRRHRQLSAAALPPPCPLAPAGGYLFVLILRPAKEACSKDGRNYFSSFSPCV